jgi:hypothetical protein
MVPIFNYKHFFIKEKEIILLIKTQPWRLNRQGFYNLKYYFFGRVAFKTNAKKPAGINPVVSNNLNLIPKSGICDTT